MSHSENTSSWPKLLRRLSTSTRPSSSVPERQRPPPLPMRPNRMLYQPQQLWTDSRPGTVVVSPGLQGLSLYVDEQQRMYESAQQRQQQQAPRQQPPQQLQKPQPPPTAVDDRAPTTERVAEFRLDIPNGVCNMTQHPGDTIVGSVVVTVTKPTRAQRISLTFLGQERVYLRDPANTSLMPSLVKVDLNLFEKRLSLWGQEIDSNNQDSAQMDVLAPGTLRIPFSIKIPHVNYPATIKRDKVCRVRYLIWAQFERPGTFRDHDMTTPKELLYMEPLAYPTRLREVFRINQLIEPFADSSTSNVAVQVDGGLSQLPAMAGDRVLYQLEIRAVRSAAASGADFADQRQAVPYTVRYVRMCVVERLYVRGLIKGSELSQSYRTDLFSVTLDPTGQIPGKHSNSAGVFASTGYLRLPVDLCPFESKQLSRTYELRIECDVADDSSLLDKVTRQTSTYTLYTPLDVCTVSPDGFTEATLNNAYADETMNISGIAPPAHHLAAAEPAIRIGGWEVERSYVKWDKHNPCWIELAKKKAAS
ncbi:hypothetical protein IW146_008944 [Coemansia sp. RSA 922]|nr:hypothetical protein IW146_008944 [Coemansia sp. RSA 922]